MPDIEADVAIRLSAAAGAVFTPGSPINEKDLFSGRLDQISQIIDAVSQRGYHAILFGERGVGKTSLSNVLVDFVGTSFLVCRLNCDASDDFSSLWHKAFKDITLTISKPGLGFKAATVTETHQLASELPLKVAPDDIRRILAPFTAKHVVIIFDEFDRLSDNQIRPLMADTIKALSDYSVPATILLIGVADSVDELIKEHQSIERALVQIPMPRMSDAEIKEILNKGSNRLGMSITKEGLEEIVSLAQGLPYIAHLLGLHCCRAALRANSLRINSTHVQTGIGASLDTWQQSIKSNYYNAISSHQPGNIYKEVLLACALAEVDELRYFTASAVRRPLRAITGKAYDIPNFAKHLKELSEPSRGGVLQRVGEKRRIRYKFNSPMLRPFTIMRGFQDGLLNKQILKELTATEV